MKKTLKKSVRAIGCIMLAVVLILTGLHIPKAGTPTVAAAASTVVEKAISWAVAIANDNSHGYSQTNRWGPDYDCSSLVISAFRNAGVNVGSATYTGNMRSQFTQHGFQWIPWSQIGGTSKLQRGDILLNEKLHTEIYLGNNQNVGAHGSKGYPQTGDQTGTEISVSGYYYHPWDGVLRYTQNAGINPTGCVDSVTDAGGAIKVAGWAFDGDNSSASICVHVYIGGPVGASGAEGHEIVANGAGDDVNKAYGISGKHRFNQTIQTSKTGTQDVYFYGINIGGGDNVLIGTGKVTITKVNNPTGCVDSVTDAGNAIKVAGWAFDGDSPSTSIYVHVYIGGPVGTSGVEGHEIFANGAGDDVNKAYGISGKHRFNQTIQTSKTGTQDVYFYGINIGGGDNVLIGKGRVTITKDTTKPTTSDGKVSDSSQDTSPQIKVWLSESGSPEETDSTGVGTTVDCNYLIRDKYTQKNLNSVTDKWTQGTGYTVTIKLYDTAGKVIKTQTYKNTDSRKFSFTPDQIGNYKVTATVSGTLEGTQEKTLKVAEKEHKYGSWTISQNASCTQTGTKKRVCSICGRIETQTIPAAGHDYRTEIIEPTSAGSGYTIHTCERCGDNFRDSYTEPQQPEEPEMTEEPRRTEEPELTEEPQQPEEPEMTEEPRRTEEPEMTETAPAEVNDELSQEEEDDDADEEDDIDEWSDEDDIVELTVAKTRIVNVRFSKKGKSAKVKWKKIKAATGYELEYSASKKFSRSKKYKIKNSSTTSKTIKKMANKKKSYIRIRTYKKIDGKIIYSKWSVAKITWRKK